ncbi:hypothetical protein ACHAW6_011752 [Cyclotella cf. meneghiniana]
MKGQPYKALEVVGGAEIAAMYQSVVLDAIIKIALTNDILPPEGPTLRMKLSIGKGMGELAAGPLVRSAYASLLIGTLEEVLNLEGTNGYKC